MAVELKFSKLDNTHWGFRLTGGSDCQMPLTVVKVSEGSIAEQVGLRENDIIIKLNNIETDQLSHDEAHEIILYSGNSFVATVVRNESNQIQQSSLGIEYEIPPLPEPSSFTNDINQVPIPGTRAPAPANTYRPFSHKTFPDIPPLESPLLFSEKYVDNFQTINQKEWKEFSSKQIQKTSTENIQSTTNMIQVQMQGALNHIDIKEIEQSAKETVDESIMKSIELRENSENVVNIEKQAISNTVDEKICSENIDSTTETKISESKIVSDVNVSEKKLLKESITVQESTKNETHDQKTTQESQTKIEMYDKSKEISLEDAKVEAIKAANTLSQQAKVKGINTFEGTKMGTVDAFKTLSENMQHKCSAVPCEAVKLETQSQTDLLLKTFFVHLTDVMVALTQMITHDHAIKCCSKACGPYCVCFRQAEKTTEENINVVKTNEKCETQIKDEKYLSSVLQTKDETKSESKSSHTEHVLKEVIDNIQSATGVDVTVNGKDPLEWLADLDDKNTTIEKVESSSQKIVKNEQISCEVEAKSEIVNEVVENVNIVSEVKQEQKLSSVSTEIVKESTTFEENQDNKESKEIKSGWDVKVASKDPQTPNTDEYVFRLDIKLKGKLPDAPSDIQEVEEPQLHEDLSIVRRPIFSIGDVQIEKSVNKTGKGSDKKVLKIRDIKEVDGEESKDTILIDGKKKMYEAIVTDVKTTCFEEMLDAKELNEFKSTSVEESMSSNAEIVTNMNSTFTNQSFSDTIVHTNLASSEVVNSTHSLTANSDITTNITNAVLDTTNTVISSIPASATGFTNDISASAYNYAGSCSVANGQEAVHETVLTSTKESIELNQNMVSQCIESSTLVEEVPLQVKTMGESSKNFASVTTNKQVMNLNADLASEDIGKPGLTNEEISEIMSGEASDVKEQHVIGLTKVLASHMNRPDDEINSYEPKSLVPQCVFLRDSEVFKALNEENLRIKAERLQEGRKKFTSFLQRPNRPIPFCKREVERLEFQEPPYKVNIKRQVKNEETSSSILSEGVFLVPEVPILIPEPQPQYLEAPEYLPDSSFPDLEDTGIRLPEKIPEKTEIPVPEKIITSETDDNINEEEVIEEEVTEKATINEETKVDETVCEEEETSDENLTVEQQLAKVQKQLVALSMLPATIQQTLDQVTKKITQMVTKTTTEETTIVQEEFSAEKEENIENTSEEIVQDETVHEETIVEEKENDKEKSEIKEDEQNTKDQNIKEPTEAKVIESSCQEISETKVKETTEVKEEKNIHELRKDLICELNEEHVMRQVKQRPGGRVGRPKPAFGPLTPQERPIVLPGGRKWRGPKDAFTDSFIAETLSGQAEVIMGKALGNHIEYIYPPYNDRVNFKKYAKPPITLDHLKSSSVYKLIHDEEEPLHGVQARAGVLLAESDYREKCRSVTPTSFNKESNMETEVN